jgi:hypothetical protein
MPRIQRTQKIQPRVQPIRGSVAAPPVPGDRGTVEGSGWGNPGIGDSDKRRQDQSSHHSGVAVSTAIGGPPAKRPYPPAKY